MPAQGRPLALLVAVRAAAFALRAEGLDARTLTYPECYVSLLDFRAPFDSPAPRAEDLVRDSIVRLVIAAPRSVFDARVALG